MLNVVEFSYTEDLEALSYDKFESWAESGKAGELKYLTDQRKLKRKSLQHVMPSCQSAMVFLYDYSETKSWLHKQDFHKVAGYSLGFQGIDYHFILKKHLEVVLKRLKEEFPLLEGKIAVDTMPILERDLAVRAGLGWIGKNSMLINRKHGSFVMIGSLLLSQKLSHLKKPVEVDHCGICRKCIDLCPTNAISEDRTLEVNQCISTFTIEMFKETAKKPIGFENSQGEVFGCDICQDVCPWNQKILKNAKPPVFNDKQKSLISFFEEQSMVEVYEQIKSMTKSEFKKAFYGTAFFRTGKKGLLKNFKAFLDI